ncbi:transposase [Streptomyces sp. NBC_01724]
MDAVLCADGPVTSLPELSLSGVHRRGHGAMYDALAQGHINVSRLRMALAGLRLPRGTDGQLSIALDVTPWPRPDAECSPERLHCHRPCRCDGVRQTIPGWPYQVAAALGGVAPRGPGRWTRCDWGPRMIPPRSPPPRSATLSPAWSGPGSGARGTCRCCSSWTPATTSCA